MLVVQKNPLTYWPILVSDYDFGGRLKKNQNKNP